MSTKILEHSALAPSRFADLLVNDGKYPLDQPLHPISIRHLETRFTTDITTIQQRHLGRNELTFYFASQFNGTTDCFQTAIVQDLDESGSNHGLFNPENVSRSWIRLKQRFPLLGSRVGVGKDGRQVLIVEEGSLGDTSPAEITFQTVSSEEQALARICDLVDSERVLSDGMLARLVILSRTDLENQIHLLIQIAHLITDGMSNASILRSFLDVLSSPSGPDKEWDLEKSLELALSQETLTSATNLSRQRWHRAIGQVISEIRASKLTGGHTLPRTFTDCTQYTLPRSELYDISFDEDKSAHIIESCRTHELTFGQVLPVLGQVALARILCRTYLRGEMSIEEWNFRRRQPTYTGGPINLRPFLDNEWYEKGGSTNIHITFSTFGVRDKPVSWR
ncbi:hypothetical protein H0H93_015028 [Arthromyces matolae]|nr:hypothetical protein H0H93_015028 [Arthromyces matolae]